MAVTWKDVTIHLRQPMSSNEWHGLLKNICSLGFFSIYRLSVF